MADGPECFTIDKLCIVNRYAKNEEKWEQNSLVKYLRISYFKDYIGTIRLEDTMETQYFDLSALQLSIGNGREACFRFEIITVYEGEIYDDTCLTGIEFLFVPE